MLHNNKEKELIVTKKRARAFCDFVKQATGEDLSYWEKLIDEENNNKNKLYKYVEDIYKNYKSRFTDEQKKGISFALGRSFIHDGQKFDEKEILESFIQSLKAILEAILEARRYPAVKQLPREVHSIIQSKIDDPQTLSHYSQASKNDRVKCRLNI